jgi:hypothetical protein
MKWRQDAERKFRRATVIHEFGELVEVIAVVMRDASSEWLRKARPHELRASPGEDLVALALLPFRFLFLGCVHVSVLPTLTAFSVADSSSAAYRGSGPLRGGRATSRQSGRRGEYGCGVRKNDWVADARGDEI